MCGNSFKNYNDVTVFINKISDTLKELGLSTDYASYLVHNYGIQSNSILNGIKSHGKSQPLYSEASLGQLNLSFSAAEAEHEGGLKKLSGSDSENPELDLLKSEIDHCIGFEMIYTPLDFIERRSGRLYFFSDSIEKYASEILNEFKNHFSWSNEKYEKEKNILFNKLQQIRNFSD